MIVNNFKNAVQIVTTITKLFYPECGVPII
jgi:hypothetical protein